MAVFLISFLVITLAALAMALGLMLGRRPIKAGCGSLLGDGGCEICGGTCERLEMRSTAARDGDGPCA